jgi:hypothetical protein
VKEIVAIDLEQPRHLNLKTEKNFLNMNAISGISLRMRLKKRCWQIRPYEKLKTAKEIPGFNLRPILSEGFKV